MIGLSVAEAKQRKKIWEIKTKSDMLFERLDWRITAMQVLSDVSARLADKEDSA